MRVGTVREDDYLHPTTMYGCNKLSCERLQRTAYNVGAFSPSAEEIRDVVLTAFPRAEISFDVDLKRQAIVDTWPADVDSTAACRDWGFAARYDFQRAFREYLIPTIV